MDPEQTDPNLQHARRLSLEADRMADTLLMRVAASPYSWAILAVTHLIAFVLGVSAGH